MWLTRAKSREAVGLLAPVKNNRSFAGFDDGHHHQLGPRGTLSRRPAGADIGDRGERVSSSQAASVQNKQLASPRIQPEQEQWRMGSGRRSRVTFLVARPAIGRLWPGRRIECRSAQRSDLNLSAVHENIRSRAYGQRFRNWFRVKASGSIGPMCFKSGAVCLRPAHRPR